nr:hypothetical protein BaRGS_007806 [Batillaria attramentaria]
MLEEVWLDYNVITHIHPNAFDVSLPNLNKFSITHNRLHAIELWPLTLHHPFCKFDFSYNLITEVTNNRNWTIDPALNYGPGWVDLSHNQLFHSPAKFLKRYGLLNPLILWAKFLHWGFDLRNNPFHCDCGFYEIVVWLGKLKTVMWRDYFNITCTSPPVFNGVSVMDLPAERLTCDVTTNCPKDCTCTERPHHKDTLVDCAGLGLSDLPDVVPDGNLTLMFANNSLVRVFPRRYLKRALTVDLSNNRIETISRKHDLGCPSREREASAYKLSLVSLAAVVVVVVVVLAVFRYESLVLLHNFTGRFKREGICRESASSKSTDQAYSRMMVHGQGHLMILDLGTVSRKCIPDPRLRAMLTLRMCYDASRTDHLHTVASKLNGVVSVDLGPAPDYTVGKERV